MVTESLILPPEYDKTGGRAKLTYPLICLSKFGELKVAKSDKPDTSAAVSIPITVGELEKYITLSGYVETGLFMTLKFIEIIV